MNTLEQLLHTWIDRLIQQQSLHDLIHSSFIREDGMLLEEYLTYEQLQFSSLSHLFDLTTQFRIKEIASYTIETQPQFVKKYVFLYLFNHLNKLVCKMNITVIIENEQYFIGSNDYFSQIVPKYRLLFNHTSSSTTEITHLSLAIKSPYAIMNIASPMLELDTLCEGDNFEQDNFYHAQFYIHEDIHYNQFYHFHLLIEPEEGEAFIEKRLIFFDVIDYQLQPFVITHSSFSLINECYPVHLSYWQNGNNINIEYPRSVSLDRTLIDEITVTDCLDNDWRII